MRFEVLGAEEHYGNHRYSNNAILTALMEQVEADDGLLFAWWVEKLFLDPRYEKSVLKMQQNPWFGVMHIPLLTPTWAMSGQNNIGHLYFMRSWRDALRNCRGIICFSDHMRKQLALIYPSLKVYKLMHPMDADERSFDYQRFSSDPSIVLVGTWLRNFEAFLDLETAWSRKLLISSYTDRYLDLEYSRYVPMISERLRSLTRVEYLDADEYDELVCSSVVFMGCLETSANNALCECISYSVPFLSVRHPAIVEYCGEDYPLLVDDYKCLGSLTMEKVLDAHDYLKSNEVLRERLSISHFLKGMENIYLEIAAG